jgi:hypothetical protein
VGAWLTHSRGGGPGGGNAPVPARARRARHAWEITGTNIARVAAADPRVARALFGTRASFGLGNPAGRQDQVPAGSQAVPTLVFRSLRTFRAELRRGRIDPGIRAVLYDPERWPQTPGAEQRDPIGAMRAFAKLAHAHRLEVILAPARDLLLVPGARCTAGGQRLDQAYLRCGLARAARYADVFSIQSQADEFDLPAYRAFVDAVAAQARAAHPGVRVFAGISTHPATGRAPGSDMAAAVAAVDGTVDGFWANVFAGRPGQLAAAVALFRTLAQR